MSKYANFPYSGAKYGDVPKIPQSAEPMYSVATAYSISPETETVVRVTWQEPSNKGVEWVGLRLVRNQNSYPETPEDGVTIWSWNYIVGGTAEQNRVITALDDGREFTDIPISHNRYAYYTMWLQKTDGSWVEAGNTFTVVPSPHGVVTAQDGTLLTTHDKVMDYLPRVYTSASQSPIDEVDKTSVLYNFLSGFSFTFDEILTLADLLIPDASGKNINPNITPAVAQNLGIENVGQMATRSQKRLIREAIYTYSRKGTPLSLGTLSESVTNFSPTLSYSPNLMLSVQDSTFYKGAGNWSAIGGCTISAVETEMPKSTSTAIDTNWTGKAVVSSAGATIQNGTISPKTRAVPVTAESDYVISFEIKSENASTDVDVSILWYDFQGNYVSESTPTNILVSDVWDKKEATVTAPVTAKWAGIKVKFNSADVFFVDRFQFELGTTAGAFKEARGVGVSLRPTKINYINNPSFENGVTGWTITDMTPTATLPDTTLPNVPSGTKMFEAVGDTTTCSIAVATFDSVLSLNDGFYTFSFYAKSSASVAASINFSVSDGAEVTSVSSAITLTADWARYSVTLNLQNPLIDPTAMSFDASLDGNFNGLTIHMDAAQIEEGYLPSDYFDGDLPTTSGCTWYNLANDSESVYYPNWTTKAPLLALELQNNIPSNTPWEINLYGLPSEKGITP